MRKGLNRIGLLLVPLAIAPGAHAQQPASPEPILEVTIDPPRVVVGQKTTLRVEVLAPNYMTGPPELPNFQVRNAVTRQLQSVNVSEQRNGASYAGVRFEFAIYPQEAGSYAITGQKLLVRYAAEPPATRQYTLLLPRVEFQALIPDAAAQLRPFVSASRLTIGQSIRRSSDQLKAGDAVTRIVTVEADDTPAMLLPPVTLAAVDGLAIYPAQPSLQDKADSRTDVLSSTRVDSATYMLERPGDYLLPAIDVRWWNAAEGKAELAHLDAVKLQVAANPAANGAASKSVTLARWNWRTMLEVAVDRWRLVLATVAALALLAWFAPRMARSVALRYRQRREAYRQSEAWSFERLRIAARGSDAGVVYFALMAWLQRLASVAPVGTIDALKEAARDPELARQINALQSELFAPGPATVAWSPRSLSRQLSVARRSLRRRSDRREQTKALPQCLNPVENRSLSHSTWRTPAR